MRSFNHEEAFTGLEAAIVLIAFVVVAAVFSYVMLGAGFYTTQKSQEVVHTSVAQASSSVEVVGNVVAQGETTTQKLTNVLFTISTTAGGSDFDVGNVLITYTDANGQQVIPMDTDSIDRVNGEVLSQQAPASGKWSVKQILNGNDDTLVQKGEQFLIDVAIPNTASKGEQFTIELKPSVGATLQIQRYVPAQVDAVNVLYE